LKPIQRILRGGRLALQPPAMDGRPHRPVDFFVCVLLTPS
jgi:hypothetical protein